MGYSVQKAIERIQTHFPEKGESEIVQEINDALDELSHEVRPRKEYHICLQDGKRFYDLNNLSGLREVESVYLNNATLVLSGSTATVDSTSIYVTSSGSSTDDFYNDYRIRITDASSGNNQTQRITDYNGTTKTATVSWDTTPATASDGQVDFEIYVSKDQLIDEIYPLSIAEDARPEYG